MAINDKTSINEGSAQKEQPSLANVYSEVNGLRQTGLLDNKNLESINEQMHKEGILPRIDFTDSSKGGLGIEGNSGGVGPDGKPALVTQASDGRSYTYDKDGHVQSVSLETGSGKDVWSYDSKDGKYNETLNGKATGKSTENAIYTEANGNEIDVSKDGSERVVNTDGTKKYDANGNLTREVSSNGEVKDLAYTNGQLESVTEYKNAADETSKTAAQTYTRDQSSGQFFAANDPGHSDAVNINVGNTINDAGALYIQHADGTTDEQRLSGADIQRNANGQLTSETYINGSQANNFTYDPTSGQLTGFDMTQKDGQAHSYVTDGSTVTVDGGSPNQQQFNGNFQSDKFGQIQVNNTDTGSNTDFRFDGAQLTRDADGAPTQVIDTHGNINTYDYNGSTLSGVNADGHQLTLNSQGKWTNADGTPANVTPEVDDIGRLSLVNNDGGYTKYNNNGTTSAGEAAPSSNEYLSSQESSKWASAYMAA